MASPGFPQSSAPKQFSPQEFSPQQFAPQQHAPRQFTPPVPQQPPPQQSAPQQFMNGSHPVVQNVKADLQGLTSSVSSDKQVTAGGQPLTHYHSLFYDLFTWKYPRGTTIFLFSVVSTIFAFHYVNVLRYVFKAAYLLFASVTLLEVAGKPFGGKGIISSMRPNRYHTIPRESIDKLFNEVHDLSNFFILEFQRVVFVENIFATIVAFVTTFTGYFLIKYIPLWALLLLTTVTAFSAPLIYLQNQVFIDEKIRQGSEFVNSQLTNGRQLTEKFAGEAAARARATAGDLSQKVQGYTQNVRGTSPAATTKREFPTAPVHQPVLNGANGANGARSANGANGANTVKSEYRPEQPILA